MSGHQVVSKVIDVRGMRCPIPVLKARKAILDVAVGQTLTLLATDSMAPLDLRHFCYETGHEFVSEIEKDGVYHLTVRRLV